MTILNSDSRRCEHTKVERRSYTWTDNWGEEHNEVSREEYPDTEDIDLHRYRCRQCGRVYYYSFFAMQYFEKGETCGIPGLRGLTSDEEDRKLP